MAAPPRRPRSLVLFCPVISPLTPTHDDAWYRFVLVHARVTAAINARLREDNSLLPVEHYDVLLCLKRAPAGGQRLRLSELAEAVTLSRSGLTRLVERDEFLATHITNLWPINSLRGLCASRVNPLRPLPA